MSRIFIALCVLSLSTTSAWAQSYRLSIKEAISMAVEKNHQVRAAGFTAEASRQGIGMANAAYYPSILFEESFNASNSPTQTFMMKLDESRFTQNDFLVSSLNSPDPQHDFRTALTMKVPIYNPAISPSKEIAVKDSEIQDTRLNHSRNEAAFTVFRLYLDIQKAQSRIKAHEQADAEAREHLRLAVVRNQSGVGLRSDELRARTHLSQIGQQLISARNSLTIAQMELASAMGLNAGDSVEISDSKIFSLPLPPSPEELVASSLENRDELMLSQAEYAKADSAVRLAHSSFLPSAGAFATYQMNARDIPLGSDNNSWTAGVALTWQLFDGFRNFRANDRAVAEKSGAAEMLEQARRESILKVRESFLRSEEMGKRLEVVKNSLQDAEETVRLLARRFENSLATMVELLDAQTVLDQTRADLVESEAHFALAKSYVYFTAGTFLKEIRR